MSIQILKVLDHAKRDIINESQITNQNAEWGQNPENYVIELHLG